MYSLNAVMKNVPDWDDRHQACAIVVTNQSPRETVRAMLAAAPPFPAV